jgi:hypothetical protein
MVAMSDDDETREADKRRAFGLTLPQLAGGALASVTTAVVASRLGVTGTVLGAAFGSVVSTIGAAIYGHSIERAQVRVVSTGERLARARAAEPGRTRPIGPSEPSEPRVQATVAPPPGPADLPRRPRRQRSSRGWRPWAITAGVLFVAAMLTITVLELALGHPVSGSKESGTTVTRVVTGGGESSPEPSKPTRSGDPDSSPTSDVSTSPEASPDGQPSTEAPSGQPSTEPPAPTSDPQPSAGDPPTSVG